jgi:hypothetical protein
MKVVQMKPIVVIITDVQPELEDCQKVVGGFVEMVYLEDGRQMLVNEEGLLKELPYNPIASQLAGHTIVGNAIVLEGKAQWT